MASYNGPTWCNRNWSSSFSRRTDELSLWKRYDMCCRSEFDFVATQKTASVALRRTSRLPDGAQLSASEVAQLSYLEMATGRSRHVTDWANEKVKRTERHMYLKLQFDVRQPSPVTNALYLDHLRDELKNFLPPLVSEANKSLTFHEFNTERQTWCSNGSSGGFKVLVDNKRVAVRKHPLMETLTADIMTGWLDSEPKLVARGSEKFDHNKARAIYGTDPIDYTIMSYAIMDMDKHFYVLPGVECGLSGMA